MNFEKIFEMLNELQKSALICLGTYIRPDTSGLGHNK